MPDLAISVGAMSKGWRRLFIPAAALVLVVPSLPKITGQLNESLSAKPPPDVFWRVRSCILFQLDFLLQVEKSRFRDNAGREARFRGQSNSDGRELRLQNEDADVENEPAGIPAGESMVITEIWQDRHRAYKIHTP
jgi:hypothetical protein